MKKTAQISNDQMIFSVQELKDKGFSYYKINQMVCLLYTSDAADE